MHEKGRGMASSSNKQKLNTSSSTTSELVAEDGFLPKIVWIKSFMEGQAHKLNKNILFQDNQTAMLLEKRADHAVVNKPVH